MMKIMTMKCLKLVSMTEHPIAVFCKPLRNCHFSTIQYFTATCCPRVAAKETHLENRSKRRLLSRETLAIFEIGFCFWILWCCQIWILTVSFRQRKSVDRLAEPHDEIAGGNIGLGMAGHGFDDCFGNFLSNFCRTASLG